MEPDFVLDTSGTEQETCTSQIMYTSVNEASTERPVPEKQKKTPARGGRRLGALKRYHEAGQFEDFKPGCLSRGLRNALNLSQNEIPLHIYRMRSIGYPPGWLRKARVEQLPTFGDDKNEASTSKVVYREDDLIAYPGFNVYSRGLREESHSLRCPGIQRHHILENFIHDLQSRGGTVEKKLDEVPQPDINNHSNLDDLEAERKRILAEIDAIKTPPTLITPTVKNVPGSSRVNPIVIDSPATNITAISSESLEEGQISDDEDEYENVDFEQRTKESNRATRSQNGDVNFEAPEATTETAFPLADFDDTFIVDVAVTGASTETLQTANSMHENADDLSQEGLSAVVKSPDEEKEDEHVPECQITPEAQEGTTIPCGLVQMITSAVNAATEEGAEGSRSEDFIPIDHRPKLDAFSVGIQPFTPYENLPNAQGAYNRVKDTLNRARNNPESFLAPEPPAPPPKAERNGSGEDKTPKHRHRESPESRHRSSQRKHHYHEPKDNREHRSRSRDYTGAADDQHVRWGVPTSERPVRIRSSYGVNNANYGDVDYRDDWSRREETSYRPPPPPPPTQRYDYRMRDQYPQRGRYNREQYPTGYNSGYPEYRPSGYRH